MQLNKTQYLLNPLNFELQVDPKLLDLFTKNKEESKNDKIDEETMCCINHLPVNVSIICPIILNFNK